MIGDSFDQSLAGEVHSILEVEGRNFGIVAVSKSPKPGTRTYTQKHM